MATKRHTPAVPPVEPQQLPQHLWDVHEVGDYVRKSSDAIYKMAERRQIPYVKLGGAIRFDPVEIQAWVRRHAVPSDSQHDVR